MDRKNFKRLEILESLDRPSSTYGSELIHATQHILESYNECQYEFMIEDCVEKAVPGDAEHDCTALEESAEVRYHAVWGTDDYRKTHRCERFVGDAFLFTYTIMVDNFIDDGIEPIANAMDDRYSLENHVVNARLTIVPTGTDSADKIRREIYEKIDAWLKGYIGKRDAFFVCMDFLETSFH